MGVGGGGEGYREAAPTPLNVTQEEGFRDEDDTFYDATSTPQGRGEMCQEVAAAGWGSAPAATVTTASPATVVSVTGERPDGACIVSPYWRV